MNRIKLILISGFLMVSLPVFADCPIDMEYKKLVDCIVVEESGESYPLKPATENTIDQGERE